MSINKIINFKENVPQNVKNALSKIGNNKITSGRVGRTPDSHGGAPPRRCLKGLNRYASPRF